eukprot:3556346-Rhodomonas_salina.3
MDSVHVIDVTGLAVTPGISLRASYAMSGTDHAYGGIFLHACYTMSGTELAYGAIRAGRHTCARDRRRGGEGARYLLAYARSTECPILS